MSTDEEKILQYLLTLTARSRKRFTTAMPQKSLTGTIMMRGLTDRTTNGVQPAGCGL